MSSWEASTIHPPSRRRTREKSGTTSHVGTTKGARKFLSEQDDIICCENISEFNESFKSEKIIENCKCAIDFNLVDVTTPSIKTNEVKVACVLDAVLCSTYNQTKQCEEECFENACVQKEIVDVWENTQNFDEVFDIVDEIKVKDNMDRIVCYDVNLSIKDSFASIGFVCVSGDVTYSFIYEKEEEGQKKLMHFSQVLPFKQEMSLSESKKESFLKVSLNANVSDIKVNVILDNATNIVKFETPVRARGELFENKLVNCVADGYMEEYESKLEFDDFMALTQPSKQVFESVEKGDFELGGEGEYTLIGYTAQNVTLVNVSKKQQGVAVEGLIGVNVILSYEGAVTSINCEYPFKTELSLTSSANAKAELSLNDIDIRLTGEMLNIECKVGYFIYCCDKFTKRYVCRIEKGEQKPKSDCALEIIFARENQTLFEIGKEFSISEKTLLEQNKDITLPLKEGDKLVVYRQKIVDFN